MHPEYPYSANYLTINKNRLHYLDEGEGDHVIVMLHGNPTWSFYFRNLIRVLKDSYRIIVPDHMGCGLSDKPRNYSYTLKQHIENLQALMDHLAIRKCSFVLHDWGGAIGFGLIARNPEIVEKIMLHNTAAFRSLRIPFRIALCKIPYFGELLVRGWNGFAGGAVRMAVEIPLDSETKNYYLKPYDSWQHRIAIHRFIRDIPLHCHHQSYATLVEAEQGVESMQLLHKKMLILWGGKDFCFTKHFYDEWIRRFPESETHYFPHYGHYLLEDGKDEVCSITKRFFSLEPMIHDTEHSI